MFGHEILFCFCGISFKSFLNGQNYVMTRTLHMLHCGASQRSQMVWRDLSLHLPQLSTHSTIAVNGDRQSPDYGITTQVFAIYLPCHLFLAEKTATNHASDECRHSKILVQSFVTSHLDYCNSVLYDISDSLL